MPMRNVKITCNIGCSGTCGALYWVHENKTTAVREGCRPHEPAQVSGHLHNGMTPHHTLSIPVCMDFGKTGNWSVVHFVADYLSTV